MSPRALALPFLWLERGVLSRPRAVFLAIAAYLLLALAVQTLLWTGGRNDDAELLLHGQALLLRYDALNPPLMQWLAWGTQTLLGPTLFATRLLITLALVASYLLTWAIARRLSPDPLVQSLCLLAPTTLLHLNFYVFINLSHTLALYLATLATLWVMIRATERNGRLIDHALLGLVVGVGLLTKYNFALVLLALTLAGLAVAPVRRALLAPRLGIAVGVALAVAGPAYASQFLAPDAFLALYASKMGLAKDAGPLAGLATVAEHGLNILLPGAAIALLLLGWRLPRDNRPLAPGPAATAAWAWRLAALFPLFLLLVLVAMVLSGLSRSFSAHHLFPLGLAMPPLVAWLATRPGVRPGARGLFGAVALVLCLVSLGALVHFTWDTARRCDGKCNIVLPYADWAADLRAAGFTRGTVVQLTSVHRQPLTNLRAFFPDSRFIRALDKQASVFAPPENTGPGACLILWDPTWKGHLPANLFATTDIPAPAPGEASEGVLTGSLALSGRPAPALAYLLAPHGLGACH
jgi:hypothetical protein